MDDGTWEKTLWNSQPYPDNYVPPSFLASLRKNTNVKPYDYFFAVFHACVVTQQISAISIFSSIFVLLLEQRLDPRLLALISLIAFLLGYLCWEILLPNKEVPVTWDLRSKAIKSSILVLLILVALSPVLRTLTASTYSDSIWPLAGVLLLLNALLADYGGINISSAFSKRLTSVISINAALSASVVLASRLPDDSSVFALILLSLLVFGQLPMLRDRTSKEMNGTKIFMTTVLAMATIILASCISTFHALFSGLTLLFVTFVIPQILVWAQGFKNEIRGPWDIASPVVFSSENQESRVV